MKALTIKLIPAVSVFNVVIGLTLACLPAPAQDWPQWGGPGRDFKSGATGLQNR
jgi:hypothetical protein